jgi:DNA-binding response OmpR family regulator
MQQLDDIAERPCHPLASRGVLMVEADPTESMKIRLALQRWNIVNPVQRVGTLSGLMSYLQGRGVYSDRDLFPYSAVILLSAQLPNFDTTRAQAWIRASLLYRKMPIILTGEVKHVPIMEAALNLGANGYMTKPFEAREFHAICRVLRLAVFFGNQSEATFR